MAEETELTTRGLDKMIKALTGQNIPMVAIGVMGNKNVRSDGQAHSNATIGAKHEFGLDGMPVRSFLRVPLAEHLNDYMEKSESFTPDVFKKVIGSGSLEPWVRLIGITAEVVVMDGFATGGFGKWKQSNMTHKKNHQTLVETQQLRNSITSEVR